MMRTDRRRFIVQGLAAASVAAGGSLSNKAALAGDGPSEYFRLPEAGSGGRLRIEESPERIVEEGLIRAGLFRTPVQCMNLLDSRSLNGRARTRLGLPRLMEWVGAGMAHPEWYFGFIIVNAHTASLAVLYGFNRPSGVYFSHDLFGSAARVRVAESTWNDTTFIRGRGFEMEVLHRLEQGFHKVKIEIEPSRKDPSVSGDLVWREDLETIQPLVLMSPIRERYFMYNHKAQMPIQGYMKIGDERIEFDPGRDLANMDEVKTYAGLGPGISYKWFNFAGFDKKGRIIGLNASKSNQKNDDYWCENCIWSGESLSMIGPVDFRTDPSDTMKPWQAFDKDGRVDITFYPEGGKKVALAPLGVYHQKCGRFQGTLKDDSGVTHEVRDYYGCAELAEVLT